jgi:N-acetylmuramoyl-L-alanine amidase
MDEENLSYSDLKQHPGHARDPENIALATAVHASMVRRIPLPDRGIKRARFHVIRATSIPSILVEGGFMNNPTDGRMISSTEYRQKMAEAIVSGVNLFRGAVSGVPQYNQPSAVASAADATQVPNLARGTIGADTDASSAIQAAAQSLAN